MVLKLFLYHWLQDLFLLQDYQQERTIGWELVIVYIVNAELLQNISMGTLLEVQNQGISGVMLFFFSPKNKINEADNLNTDKISIQSTQILLIPFLQKLM